VFKADIDCDVESQMAMTAATLCVEIEACWKEKRKKRTANLNQDVSKW